jgi:hypothetical protein
MDRQETGKAEGRAELVRVGGRTYRVRTQVLIEEVDEDAAAWESEEVRQGSDGSFETMLLDADAASIDRSEQAILRTSWPAIREALSQHLTAVSKKKPVAR